MNIKEDDLTYLRHRNNWPRTTEGIPYCCLRKWDEAGGYWRHAFLVGHGWTLNFGYIFDGGDGDYLEYESAEEIIEEGWRVD